MAVSKTDTGSSCKRLVCSAGSRGDPLPSSGGADSLGLHIYLSKSCLSIQECGYQLSHGLIKQVKCCPVLQKEHFNPSSILLTAFMQNSCLLCTRWEDSADGLNWAKMCHWLFFSFLLYFCSVCWLINLRTIFKGLLRKISIVGRYKFVLNKWKDLLKQAWCDDLGGIIHPMPIYSRQPEELSALSVERNLNIT